MPINYKEYHPKWSLISKLVRFRRAQNKCEFCGVPNKAFIKRDGKGDWVEIVSFLLTHTEIIKVL